MFKPRFWDHTDPGADPGSRHFGYRRRWLMIVSFTTIVTLAPLLLVTLVDYRMTRHAFETEVRLGTSRIVSNAWRSVSHALSQRRSALTLVARDNTFAQLMAPGRLTAVFNHLQAVMGGFVNLDVVDDGGKIRARADLAADGKNMAKAMHDFDRVAQNGVYISEVTNATGPGDRLILAIRQDLDDDAFFVLRSTLDVSLFDDLIAQLALDDGDDAFIVDGRGVLQTHTRYHGNRFDRLALAIPESATGTRVVETTDPNGNRFVMGVAPIADSPFLFIMVRAKPGLMEVWLEPRMRLIGFLFFNIVVILVTILIAATYMVNRIHATDQRRVYALHQAAYANKLASIGRLASGVAHEVNNPLAIINQKAGLIKDLTTLQQDALDPQRISGLVEDVLTSVQRCGAVTRRMLDFARHMESSIEAVDVAAVAHEVVAFMEKEAQQRSITVTVATKGELPIIESDRGNLQQILLNLINNAVAAMHQGGQLTITLGIHQASQIYVTVADNGPGIPEEDLKHVFEPFFSTRSDSGGAGLGLPVTYGMITEMGGTISVHSKVNEGSTFTITLPLRRPGEAPAAA